MHTIFLDANVYFSGTLSPDGGSGFIIALAGKRTFFRVATSQYVLEEALRNLRRKTTATYTASLLKTIAMIEPILIPPREAIAETLNIINVKDAPVLRAAIDVRADALITLDKRHFLTPSVRAYANARGVAIQTPREFLREFLQTHGTVQ